MGIFCGADWHGSAQFVDCQVKSFHGGHDLLTIRVKKRVECKCLRIDDAVSLEHFISIFGITAVVGCHIQQTGEYTKLDL